MRRHILSSRRGDSDRTRRTIDMRPCARLPCALCSASSTRAVCMMGSVRALALQSFSPASLKKGPCSLRSRQARPGVGRFSPWVLSVRSSLTTLSVCRFCLSGRASSTVPRGRPLRLSGDLLFCSGARIPVTRVVKRLVELSGGPQTRQQHRELAGHRYHRPLLGAFASPLRDLFAVTP